MIPHVLLTLALLGLSLLLGATVYESVVMAPNFERDIPSSIDLARRFLKRTPAHYFRVVAPLTQLVLLASVIACWKIPDVRWPTVAAFGALVLVDVITYTFHYPRLAIMFKGPVEDPERLRRAAREWAAGNVVRAILILLALLSVLHAIIEGLEH